MYQVSFTRPAKKDLKKIPILAVAEIKNRYYFLLKNNPCCGEKLHGSLKDFWKLDFRSQGTSYRIAYQFSLKGKIILIIQVGTRENFYQQLKRRVR